MVNKFVPICQNSLPKLLALLQNRLPKSAMIYNIAKFVIDKRLTKNIKASFYAYNGLIEETETNESPFIAATIERFYHKSICVVLSYPGTPTNEMRYAFENFMDWKNQLLFCAMDKYLISMFDQIKPKLGQFQIEDALKGENKEDHTEYAYFIKIEKAINFSIDYNSSEIEVRELKKEEAEIVANHWKFASIGTKEHMEETIETIGSAGIFHKESGQLISWVIFSALGSINALYTLDKFRKNGYGLLTMRAVCKIAAERGLVPNVQIEWPNIQSKRLMEQVGFEKSHDIEWRFYVPFEEK